MKLRLLEYLRCPACHERLTLVQPVVTPVVRAYPCTLTPCSGACPFPGLGSGVRDCEACARLDVTEGGLSCDRCGAQYRIVSGVPRMLPTAAGALDRQTVATGSSFGFLWGQSAPPQAPLHEGRFHLGKMEVALGLPPLAGLTLDAGCGEGVDLEVQGRSAHVEIIGVDLSDGGCRASVARTACSPNVHVVQGDLGRLPFRDDQFARVYSYGVIHHLVDPQQGMSELGRVAGPDAGVAIYLYEDFSERSRVMWELLRLANQLRRVTTRLPHGLLYLLCRVASPLVFVLLTVPYRVLRRLPPLRRVADAIPFRHGTGPFSLTGDLFDRLSAPLEHRYSSSSARDLMERGGVRVTRMANVRGWMLAGVKPRA